MADLYDEFGVSPKSGADLYDEFGVAPKPRQVGALEAGKRGATQFFASGQQRLGNIAMLPIIGAESVANLFRETPGFGMSDWGMRKFVTPFERMAQEAAIKKHEQMGLAATASNVLGSIAGMFLGSPESLAPVGQLPRLMQHAVTPLEKGGNALALGFVHGQPMAQTNMVGRSNQLQAQGVPEDVANAATLHSYGTTDAAAFGLPLAVAGKALVRGAQGGLAMMATEVPSIMMENEVLRAAGQGAHAQDPWDVGNLAKSGGIGAAMAMMLLGRRPQRALPTPESMQKDRELYSQLAAEEEAAASARYRPEVGEAYRAAGEDPDSVARAFDRARLFGTPDPNPDITTRTVKGELTPEQIETIKSYTGATDKEIAAMSESGKRKLWMRATKAEGADAQRETLVTSFGEEPLSSPASKPSVPGDRMAMPGELDESGRRLTGDAREAGIGADVHPEVAKRAAEAKAEMLEKLDKLRQQKDALDNNEVRRELRRKADMGLTMTDMERKAHGEWEAQREKLGKSIFDLEGKIYDTEARSEQGSRTFTGTSDRPFRMDEPALDSFEAAARPEAEARARAKAAEEERAAIDRLEAEWRERQRMRRQEEAQQQAGQRNQQGADAASNKYQGTSGSKTEAPMEGGKFKADESGFIMSDNGSPLQFGHQRDAGWWILKRGNKGNTGQVFEIANHPSGKGYTVRVIMDNGGRDAGRRTGDGGGTGSGGVGGRDLVQRGVGDQGTGATRGRNPSVANTDGGAGAVAPVAASRGASGPLDPPEVVAEVKRMAENTGLAQVGGRMLRGSENWNHPEYHTITRTKAIPREEWWLGRPSTDRVGKRGKVTRRFKHSEAETKAAVKAWLEGRTLTAKQQEIVDFMRAVAKAGLDERAEDAARVRAERMEDQAEAQRERDATRDETAILDDPEFVETAILDDSGFVDFSLGRRVSVDDFEAWLGGVDGKERNQGNAGQADAGEAPAGGRTDRAEGQPADGADGEARTFVLDGYRPDDIRARDAQRDAERADAQRERQPVSDPDEFVLTGSDRHADQAEARGQTSIFGYGWDDIQRAQQGGSLSRKVDTSRPMDSDMTPDRLRADEALLNEHGVDGLKAKEFFGVLDRLKRAGLLDDLRGNVGKEPAEPAKAETSKADVDRAKKGASRSGTLSANPFADPAVWAQAAKDAGHALKAIVQALRDVFGWNSKDANHLRDTLRDIAEKFKLGSQERRAKADSHGNLVIRLYRTVLESAGTDMLGIAKRSGSQTMQDIVRKFAHLSADVSGQSETVSQRVEYEWARQMVPVAKALEAVEKLAKDARRDPKEVMRQVSALARNPRGLKPGTPVHDAAIAIRKALDGAYQYMRDAGMEVGHIKDYYPREFDMETVRSAPLKQLQDALAQAYRETGLNPEAAKLAAESLANKLLYGGDSMFDRGIGKPEGDFIKSRVFGPAVDNPSHPLHKYLEHDPRVTLSSYLQRAVRRAETVRVVGDTPEKWEGMRRRMIDEGATPEALEDLQDFIQTIGGMVGDKGLNRSILSAVSWMRTLGSLMLLEKAVMTSVSESIMPAIRSGNLLDVHRSVATTVKSLFMKKRPDVQELHALAEDMGMLINGIGSNMLMHRWHGGDITSKAQTYILDNFFRMTGLSQYTEATRVAALDIGRIFVRRLAKQDGKLANDMLGEVGIPPDKQDAFRSWLLKTGDGIPTLADLQKAPQDMRTLYYTAMRKFESDSIMRPNQTTRPGWMNKPVLGLLGQLLSYSYAFYNHVLKRNVKMAGRALTGADYTALERAKMAAPFIMMPLLAAIQGLVGEARDALFADPDRELETWQKITRAFSRGIPVAPVDPWLNVFAGAKFQRSATETLAGPVLGIAGRSIDAYVDYVMRNSEYTNTQERALQKAIYDIMLEPGGAILLSFAFANAHSLPLQLGYAAARQALGSGQIREEYVDAVAGEKTRKQSGGDNSGGSFDSGFKSGFDAGQF